MAKKIVRVEQDDSPSNPHAENDGTWDLDSLIRDGGSEKCSQWNYLTDNERVQPWLANKLRVGLAWWLTFIDYGSGWPGAKWSIIDNVRSWVPGPRGYPDGILIWRHKPGDMGARTLAERRKDAEDDLNEYNAYLNGWSFGYIIEDADGEEIDSCWGYTIPEKDTDSYVESLADAINQHLNPQDRVLVKGSLVYGLEKRLKAIVLDQVAFSNYRDPEPEYSI